MNRAAIRTPSAVLAVALTCCVLNGIAMLADVESSAHLVQVVLPRVEVSASAPSPSPVAASHAVRNRL